MSIDSPVRGGEEKRALHPFFDDKKSQKIALEECDDIDLKTISEKVAHTNLTTTEIGGYFGLNDATVQMIEEDYECGERSDKIHKLLVQWRIERDERKESTLWDDLIRCLESLSDEQLLDDVKAYLQQKESPHTSFVGRHQVECVQESNNSSVMMPFIQSASSTNSHDLLVKAAFADVPSQVQHDERGYRGALVTGKSSQPVLKRGIPVNLIVKERVDDLEGEFAKLVTFAHKKLKPVISVDDLRVYITQLSVSQKEHIPLFSRHMAEILSETSHSKIFALLSRMGAWSMLNFRLLHRIAKAYGDDELEAEVSSYSADVDLFKQETKLEDYLYVWSSRSAYGSLPERQALIIKLADEWKDCTLADVAQEERYLANEFQLEPYIMHFSNGNPGCVVLMWLIPTAAVPLIQKAMEKGATLNRKTLQLIVGDVTYNIKVQSDPLEQLMKADYTKTYAESIRNPEKFWGELSKCLDWEKLFEKVMDCDMKEGVIRWFKGGKLNVSVNCLDRHDPERIALIWEKDEPKQDEKVTYRELLDMTCRIANVLKRNKIKKGDTVVIYMPAAPITVASMLACARIGAIHSVVFTAFQQAVLRQMIINANAKAIITANQRSLGGVVIPLKATVDQAVVGTAVEVVFVSSGVHDLPKFRGPLGPPVTQHATDVLLEKAMEKESTECPPELMDSEDELFIMYTSGTSDEPKGIVHTQAGYLLYAAITHKCVFNYKPEEVFACVADLGWITGHSYVVYGPLCNGGTTVLFDSTVNYPDYERYWEMISRLKVNHFYTTPAAIRLLMKAGDDLVKKHDLSSLKTIGSVGEPLSAGAWTWYNNIVGKENCTIVDTWWQTETGGIAITPHPAPSGSRPKPGFPMKPFFGVEPVIVDDEGKTLEGPDVTGLLCLKKPLPGMGRRINGDPHKYKKDYFQHFPGLYFTNDIATRDADGDYKILGRTRDIKGVWISIPEIENAMNMSDPRVLESYLVPCQEEGSEEIKHKVIVQLTEKGVSEEEKRQVIKAIEKILIDRSVPPRRFIVVNKPPKTHSGKIVRHLLRELASRVEGQQFHSEVQGDTTYRDSLYEDELKAIATEEYLGETSNSFYAIEY